MAAGQRSRAEQSHVLSRAGSESAQDEHTEIYQRGQSRMVTRLHSPGMAPHSSPASLGPGGDKCAAGLSSALQVLFAEQKTDGWSQLCSEFSPKYDVILVFYIQSKIL